MKIFNIELTLGCVRKDLVKVLEGSSFSGMIEEIGTREYKLIGQIRGDINALNNFRQELKANYIVIK